MKKSVQKIVLLILGFCFHLQLFAQESKPTCAVFYVEVKNNSITYEVNSSTAGIILRREMEKNNLYQVINQQDMKEVIRDSVLNVCYSQFCLLEYGSKLKVDKVLSGYIDSNQSGTIVSIRELDVQSGKISKSITKEFIKNHSQIHTMIQICLADMYDLPKDVQVEKLLVDTQSRESFVNNNGKNRLNLSGFRVGAVYVLGNNSEILTASETEGGFGASKTLFQFGYQLETQYLNIGRMQALFEFIPTFTGLEQGLLLPSLSLLHGIRDNKTGFEIAFGPTFGLTQTAHGYYDDEGKWNYVKDENTYSLNYPLEERLDSRGESKLNTGFVLGVGFSLKSGNLNIPINMFSVFQKDSYRVGLSFGINGKNNSYSTY